MQGRLRSMLTFNVKLWLAQGPHTPHKINARTMCLYRQICQRHNSMPQEPTCMATALIEPSCHDGTLASTWKVCSMATHPTSATKCTHTHTSSMNQLKINRSSDRQEALSRSHLPVCAQSFQMQIQQTHSLNSAGRQPGIGPELIHPDWPSRRWTHTSLHRTRQWHRRKCDRRPSRRNKDVAWMKQECLKDETWGNDLR